MTQENFFPKNIIFIFIFLSFFGLSSAVQNYSIQEVQKVLKAIETMSSEQFRKDRDVLKKIVITESELDSYIAYRIEIEKEEIMRELRLKLLQGNMIEGKILIDLTGQKMPKFLRPRMTFFLGGKIEVQDGRVKLVIKDLFLEGQPIQPMILDLVIYIAAKIENTEASSINDWYDLPYGIKNIKTQKGKATFYY